MAGSLNDAHHTWVKEFTSGAVDPAVLIASASQRAAQTAAGTPAKLPPLRVALIHTDARTEQVLGALEQAVRSKSKTVSADGHNYPVDEAADSINKEFKDIVEVLKNANRDSLYEADEMIRGAKSFTEYFSNLAGGNKPEKIGAEVRKVALGVNDTLNRAEKLATQGEWLAASSFLKIAVSEDQEAKKLLSKSRDAQISGAENMQKGLEITRDASFATAKTLAAASGAGLAAEAAMAVLPKVMETVNKIQLDQPVNPGMVTVDLVMTVLLTKYEGKLTKSLNNMVAPLVVKVMHQAPGLKTLEEGVFRKVYTKVLFKAEHWIKDQIVGLIKSGGKGAIKSLASTAFEEKKKENKSQSWAGLADHFIEKLTSAEFWERELGEKIREYAVEKAKEIATDMAQDKLKGGMLGAGLHASDGEKLKAALEKGGD